MTWGACIRKKVCWGGWVSAPADPSLPPWIPKDTSGCSRDETQIGFPVDESSEPSSNITSQPNIPRPKVVIPSPQVPVYVEDRHGQYASRPDNGTMRHLHRCHRLDRRQIPIDNRYTNGLRISNSGSAVVYTPTTMLEVRSHVKMIFHRDPKAKSSKNLFSKEIAGFIWYRGKNVQRGAPPRHEIMRYLQTVTVFPHTFSSPGTFHTLVERISATIEQIHANVPLRRDFRPGSKFTSWKHDLSYDEQELLNGCAKNQLLPVRSFPRRSQRPPFSTHRRAERQLLSPVSPSINSRAEDDSSIPSVAHSVSSPQKIKIAPAVVVVLSSDDEECSTKLVPKRSLALTQPIPKKQKCSRTVTVPVQKLPPVDSVIKPNQCV